jgi:1,4-dihydroxy-2-naphthoate octaprenyltransferase
MYSVLALLGLMLLTWAAAVWATYVDEKKGVESETASGRQVFSKSA